MNGTVVDIGEVQEYDDLGDLSPVDSMSAWEVCGGANGFGSVALKEEFNDSDFATAGYARECWLQPWGSTMQPTPMVKAAAAGRKKRGIRDILREVTVSEEMLQSAVARLGGGAQGLQVLMDHVNFWASQSHDADVAATIRNGIVDLGMTTTTTTSPPPPPPLLNGRTPNTNTNWTNPATEPPGDRGAAYTRALRKSHMVRQRGHPSRAQRGGGHHHSLSSKSQCGWRSGTHHQSWAHDLNPELGSGNSKGYEFLFQKELRASDVSSLGRIVLPKKDAERHLPFLIVREGMMINLEDYQSGAFWTVRYRFWPNNKSRMYLLENIGGFVTYHRLQEGDLLLCYRNGQGGYVIRGQRVPPSVKGPAKGPSSKGTQARETTETAEMKSTMDSAPMPPTSQFMEGDQSTIGSTDSNSDLSLDSLECTLRELSDGHEAFEESGYGGHGAEQMDHGFTSTFEEDDVLRTGDFGSESHKELDVNDSSFAPVVDMLSVNVKQRYLDRVEFFEPE